ncbi:hypothetical protein LTR85_005509 [Meristemomyces frigidus]|nr:hypothetical protein LTR85_005509 [Meristemomyces frigidus]
MDLNGLAATFPTEPFQTDRLDDPIQSRGAVLIEAFQRLSARFEDQVAACQGETKVTVNDVVSWVGAFQDVSNDTHGGATLSYTPLPYGLRRKRQRQPQPKQKQRRKATVPQEANLDPTTAALIVGLPAGLRNAIFELVLDNAILSPINLSNFEQPVLSRVSRQLRKFALPSTVSCLSDKAWIISLRPPGSRTGIERYALWSPYNALDARNRPRCVD